MFNQTLYQKNLSRYSKPSFIEQEVNQRLLEKLDFIHDQPKTILDLGCGGGEGLKLLGERFPEAKLHGLDLNKNVITKGKTTLADKSIELTHADFNQKLPYPAHHFDLVIANFSIQASDNIYELLERIFEILKPNGLFLFSLLAEESLPEFQESWHAIDQSPHNNPFISTKDMAGILQESKFKDPVLDCEHIALEYAEVKDAIADIREFNEPLALNKIRTTLTGKSRWQKFEETWQKNYTNGQGKITSSYHIMYGHACKPEKAELKLKGNEARIGLAELSAFLKKEQK